MRKEIIFVDGGEYVPFVKYYPDDDPTLVIALDINKYKNYKRTIKWNLRIRTGILNLQKYALQNNKFELYMYLKELFYNPLKFVNDADCVVLDGDINKISATYNDIKSMLNKNMVIHAGENFSNEYINDLKNILKNDRDNVLIGLDGNSVNNLITFDKYEQTAYKIREITNEIKRMNLSPFETLIYVYDIVRDRYYQRESQGEKSNSSRDISEILFNDRIVCVGFSNLMTTLLNNLGIKCQNIYLSGTEKNNYEGHVRNEVYLQDNKYGINGVFMLDSTFDCKKPQYPDQYLETYYHFCKNVDFFKGVDNSYIFDEMPIRTNNIYEKLCNLLGENNSISNSEPAIESVNHMSRFLYNKSLMDDGFLFKRTTEETNTVLNNALNLLSYYQQTIPGEVLLRGIYEVREKEHMLNPTKYPFNLDSLLNIYYYSGTGFYKTPEEIEEYGRLTPQEKNVQDVNDFYQYAAKENLQFNADRSNYQNVKSFA